MPRPLLYRPLLLLGAALLLFAPRALAQSDTPTTPASTAGSLVVQVTGVGDEDAKLGAVQIGIDACKTDAPVKFQIDGVPADRESLDVFTEDSCNLVTARDGDATGECKYVGTFPADSTTKLMVEIPAGKLIGDCNESQMGALKVWFLAKQSSSRSEDVMNFYGVPTGEIRVDLDPPAAPTGVKGGSGESLIPVKWSGSGSDLKGFTVLIDPNPTSGGSTGVSGSGSSMDDEDGGAVAANGGNASGGECGSSVLTPGASASGLPSDITKRTINESTATSLDLKPGDIEGDSAAVAVVAIDEAGNQSVMSAIACVKVVPTNGFWDRYNEDPDAVDAGCPCAALGPAQLESAWPIALSLSLIGLSARRRRRS